MRGRAVVGVGRAKHGKALAGLGDGGGGWRIEPAEAGGIGHAPKREIEDEAGQVGFQYFGRIEGEEARGLRFVPKAIGDARRLPAGAARALIGRRSEEHTSELQTLMRNSYAVF